MTVPDFEEWFRSLTTTGPNRTLPGAVLIAADATGSTSVDADPTSAQPIYGDSVFWIASCTKLMTTIAALQCVENGLLKLDDPELLSDLLPEYASPKILVGFGTDGAPQLVPADKKKWTIRALLTHTSGLGYDFLSPNLQRWKSWAANTTAGGDSASAVMPLLFEPGTQFEYGISIDIVGRVIERATGGTSLEDYMRFNIWERLGMHSTTLDIDSRPDLHARRCALTSRSEDDDGRGRLTAAPPHPLSIARSEKGGGGAFSTPNDYIKILASLLKNDGVLLQDATVKSMFLPQISDASILHRYMGRRAAGAMCRSGVKAEAWNFGLGGILNMEDVPGFCRQGTMSWSGLPGLFWWIDPRSGISGLYASQVVPPMDPATVELYLRFRKEMFHTFAPPQKAAEIEI